MRSDEADRTRAHLRTNDARSKQERDDRPHLLEPVARTQWPPTRLERQLYCECGTVAWLALY